jgi:hypothetical protein
MPRTKNGVNKSEEIRKILRSNPTIPAKEVVSTLAARGIKVKDPLVEWHLNCRNTLAAKIL